MNKFKDEAILLKLFFIITIVTLTLSCSGDNDNPIDDPNKTCEGDDCNNENPDDIYDDAPFVIGTPSASTKKVYMHYLSWFGEPQSTTDKGRHWNDGTVNQPVIGYYDSKSWSTHLYHILLSSVTGVDGAIINVRTDYDEEAFELFLASLKRVEDVYAEFDYALAISYDDQDMTLESARTEFTKLKNEYIASTSKYLHKDDNPVVFVWNYDGFLTSEDYRTVADEIFTDKDVVLLKNEIDLNAAANETVMNSFYPWVQGFADDGSNWGEGYLDWYYQTTIDFELNNKIDFVTGAVWPGFDDRSASWGQNRWIDRKDGDLYNTMWSKTNQSSGNIDWVIIETWNDFNEGTEIEPTKESNFKYLELTATNIATYKNTTSNIDEQKYMLGAPVKIYEAAKLIENGDRDYDTYYPKLELSIKRFLQGKGELSYDYAEEIINAN